MDNTNLSRQEMLAALEWYSAVGVDLIVRDDPVDRFAENAANSLLAKPVQPALKPKLMMEAKAPAPVAMPSMPELDADPSVATALAEKAETLDALNKVIEEFEGCGLKLRASNTLFGVGNPQAQVMFVAGAPSKDDDLSGLSFSGKAGDLFNKMLASIGLKRDDVFLSYCLPWRPPGNRAPSPSEINSALPFLMRQIELVSPKIVIALGDGAAQNLLLMQNGINRERGQWIDLPVGGATVKALATLHPSYLLIQPAAKRLAWHDLLAIQQQLTELQNLSS